MITVTNIIFFWWLPSFASVLLALYISEGNLSDILTKDITLLALFTLTGGWIAAFLIIVLICSESAKDPNTLFNRKEKNDD